MASLAAWVEAGADELPFRQRVVAILVAVAILVLVVELVRRRRLREEYSVLWLLTGLLLLLLATQYRLLVWATDFIGAAQPPSTLFFGGLIFLILLCLMFSVRLSRLTWRVRTLSQEIALLKERLEQGGRHGGEESGQR